MHLYLVTDDAKIVIEGAELSEVLALLQWLGTNGIPAPEAPAKEK